MRNMSDLFLWCQFLGGHVARNRKLLAKAVSAAQTKGAPNEETAFFVTSRPRSEHVETLRDDGS